MNIVLFGPPGAGKGTQSQLLMDRMSFMQISTGDLFRSAMKNQTPLGLKAKSFIDKGNLVPDSITVELVEEALEKLSKKPFILDGFPRNVTQADTLENILKNKGLKLGRAVFLEVPKEELVTRLSRRRVCKACGAVYHISSRPPRKLGVCDTCGGEVIQRADDQSDVIRNRLSVYEQSTAPLKEYYSKVGLYVAVDGSKGTEQVYQGIAQVLKA